MKIMDDLAIQMSNPNTNREDKPATQPSQPEANSSRQSMPTTPKDNQEPELKRFSERKA